MRGSLRGWMLDGIVGSDRVSGGSAGGSGRLFWPVRCPGRGQAWSGRLRAAVACGALWLAGRIGSRPVVAGSVISVCPGVARKLTPREVRRGRCGPGGSGASCCVACEVPGVLRDGAVSVLPLSVRRRLRGGQGVSLCGVGLELMSHRRLPSLCVAWRVSRRRLRTYGWSWGAESSRGWTLWGQSASASMASHASCRIHPPAGWS